MAYSTGSNFGRTNYSHKEQMIRCGISSLKCFDGEDLSKTIFVLNKCKVKLIMLQIKETGRECSNSSKRTGLNSNSERRRKKDSRN